MFHSLSPESVIDSIRSIISLPSIHYDQKKKPQGSYDLKSKTGSFELWWKAQDKIRGASRESERGLDCYAGLKDIGLGLGGVISFPNCV